MTGVMGINDLIQTGEIFVGTLAILALIGFFIYSLCCLEKEEPIIPWSARAKVTKAKARAAVMQQELAMEEIEIRRLQLEPQRQAAMLAIERGPDTNPNGLTTKEEADTIRENFWTGNRIA